jgi:hypothetical protein
MLYWQNPVIKVGDLVNNVDASDYNYGMVLENHISVAEELIAHGAPIDWPLDARETEPPGARILWECGDINIHYFDELEVIGEASKPME